MTDSWWNVYNELGELLLRQYQKHNNRAGIKLYQLLNGSSKFVSINNWIKKFDSNAKVKRLDPLHIYASINGNKITVKNRLNRINVLFDLLGSKNEYKEIDFKGCPSPFVISILSARSEKSQEDIWKLFSRVIVNENRGITNEDFENIKSWYGVEIASLTIFLFWIKSDYYLPLDKNVKSFLQAAKLIDREPKNYEEYLDVVSKIDKYNKSLDYSFGKKGLFREISYFSYIIVNDGKELKNYSSQFTDYYKNEKLDSKNFYKPEQTKVELAFAINESNIRATLNMGFKIVAVKPLKKCNEDYLNNLKPGKVYSLESAFSFVDGTILYDSKKDVSLFYQSDVKINVTAIVGKNGSGKSSLVELLFRTVNNIAFSLKTELNTSDLKHEEDLCAELYYIVNGRLYCIELKQRNILIQDYFFENSVFKIEGKKRKFKLVDLENFFYTVAINYSHYSLNSNILGQWINGLFHKNDSYQTPIVINPMRIEGIIDINRENDLVKSRLLVNLFSRVEEDDIGIRQLTEKQKAIEVEFVLNEEKNIPKSDVELSYLESVSLKTRNKIFELIYKYFDFVFVKYDKSNKVIKCNEEYIIRKLIKISNTYTIYKDYFNEITTTYPSFDDALLEDYISKLSTDRSHITYKLYQAINYLKYYDLISKEENFTLQLDTLVDKLDSGYNLDHPELQETPLIEILPPSIFNINIILESEDEVISDFDRLSSGEKQQIHSISSILYHVNNIDSVSSEELITYSNIHILLDEIELYYHPEMQRRYLGYFLNMLSKLTLNNINAINICMVTHSPYILSDIPNVFTLSLIDGEPQEYKNKTFGANIHDLLAKDFFMEDGFMGEIAKKKIEETIKFLNHFDILNQIKLEKDDEKKSQLEKKYDEENRDFISQRISIDHEYHAKIINLIGEPIIRYRLEDKYNELFKRNTDKDVAEQRIREIAKDAGLNLSDLKE